MDRGMRDFLIAHQEPRISMDSSCRHILQTGSVKLKINIIDFRTYKEIIPVPAEPRSPLRCTQWERYIEPHIELPPPSFLTLRTTWSQGSAESSGDTPQPSSTPSSESESSTYQIGRFRVQRISDSRVAGPSSLATDSRIRRHRLTKTTNTPRRQPQRRKLSSDDSSPISQHALDTYYGPTANDPFVADFYTDTPTLRFRRFHDDSLQDMSRHVSEILGDRPKRLTPTGVSRERGVDLSLDPISSSRVRTGKISRLTPQNSSHEESDQQISSTDIHATKHSIVQQRQDSSDSSGDTPQPASTSSSTFIKSKEPPSRRVLAQKVPKVKMATALIPRHGGSTDDPKSIIQFEDISKPSTSGLQRKIPSSRPSSHADKQMDSFSMSTESHLQDPRFSGTQSMPKYQRGPKGESEFLDLRLSIGDESPKKTEISDPQRSVSQSEGSKLSESTKTASAELREGDSTRTARTRVLSPSAQIDISTGLLRCHIDRKDEQTERNDELERRPTPGRSERVEIPETEFKSKETSQETQRFEVKTIRDSMSLSIDTPQVTTGAKRPEDDAVPSTSGRGLYRVYTFDESIQIKSKKYIDYLPLHIREALSSQQPESTHSRPPQFSLQDKSGRKMKLNIDEKPQLVAVEKVSHETEREMPPDKSPTKRIKEKEDEPTVETSKPTTGHFLVNRALRVRGRGALTSTRSKTRLNVSHIKKSSKGRKSSTGSTSVSLSSHTRGSSDRPRSVGMKEGSHSVDTPVRTASQGTSKVPHRKQKEVRSLTVTEEENREKDVPDPKQEDKREKAKRTKVLKIPAVGYRRVVGNSKPSQEHRRKIGLPQESHSHPESNRRTDNLHSSVEHKPSSIKYKSDDNIEPHDLSSKGTKFAVPLKVHSKDLHEGVGVKKTLLDRIMTGEVELDGRGLPSTPQSNLSTEEGRSGMVFKAIKKEKSKIDDPSKISRKRELPKMKCDPDNTKKRLVRRSVTPPVFMTSKPKISRNIVHHRSKTPTTSPRQKLSVSKSKIRQKTGTEEKSTIVETTKSEQLSLYSDPVISSHVLETRKVKTVAPTVDYSHKTIVHIPKEKEDESSIICHRKQRMNVEELIQLETYQLPYLRGEYTPATAIWRRHISCDNIPEKDVPSIQRTNAGGMANIAYIRRLLGVSRSTGDAPKCYRTKVIQEVDEKKGERLDKSKNIRRENTSEVGTEGSSDPYVSRPTSGNLRGISYTVHRLPSYEAYIDSKIDTTMYSHLIPNTKVRRVATQDRPIYGTARDDKKTRQLSLTLKTESLPELKREEKIPSITALQRREKMETLMREYYLKKTIPATTPESVLSKAVVDTIQQDASGIRYFFDRNVVEYIATEIFPRDSSPELENALHPAREMGKIKVPSLFQPVILDISPEPVKKNKKQKRRKRRQDSKLVLPTPTAEASTQKHLEYIHPAATIIKPFTGAATQTDPIVTEKDIPRKGKKPVKKFTPSWMRKPSSVISERQISRGSSSTKRERKSSSEHRERESSFMYRERESSSSQGTLDSATEEETRESSLGTRESSLGTRESSLGTRESSLGTRESSSETEESSLETGESSTETEESSLETGESSLEEGGRDKSLKAKRQESLLVAGKRESSLMKRKPMLASESQFSQLQIEKKHGRHKKERRPRKPPIVARESTTTQTMYSITEYYLPGPKDDLPAVGNIWYYGSSDEEEERRKADVHRADMISYNAEDHAYRRMLQDLISPYKELEGDGLQEEKEYEPPPLPGERKESDINLERLMHEQPKLHIHLKTENKSPSPSTDLEYSPYRQHISRDFLNPFIDRREQFYPLVEPEIARRQKLKRILLEKRRRYELNRQSFPKRIMHFLSSSETSIVVSPKSTIDSLEEIEKGYEIESVHETEKTEDTEKPADIEVPENSDIGEEIDKKYIDGVHYDESEEDYAPPDDDKINRRNITRTRGMFYHFGRTSEIDTEVLSSRILYFVRTSFTPVPRATSKDEANAIMSGSFIVGSTDIGGMANLELLFSRERRTFGKWGWNVPYAFSDMDFLTAWRIMKTILNRSKFQSKTSPPDWVLILLLIGQGVYGAQIVDKYDLRVVQRCMEMYLQDYLILGAEKFIFCKTETFEYRLPDLEDKEWVFTDNFPQETDPEAIGIHPNAVLIYARKKVKEMCKDFTIIHEGQYNYDPMEHQQELSSILQEIEPETPNPFNVESLMYAQIEKLSKMSSLSYVLLQELERMNCLINTMITTISQLRNTLKGEEVIGTDMEELAQALFNGEVPSAWKKFSPESNKSLGNWLYHLRKRANQFHLWIQHGDLQIIWLGGLCAPKAYLTAIRQMVCKIYGYQLHCTRWLTTVTRYASYKDIFEDLIQPSARYLANICHEEDIEYIQFYSSLGESELKKDPSNNDKEELRYRLLDGLYIEGARWERESHQLANQYFHILQEPMPLIGIQCVNAPNLQKPELDEYDASKIPFTVPVYLSSQRRHESGEGLLLDMRLCAMQKSEQTKWIMKGIALVVNSD